MIGPSSIELSGMLVNVSDNRYVVNVGCYDGKSFDDPCYPLYEQGFPGLAIDGANFPDIHNNLPNENVIKLMGTYMTPINAPQILRDNGCHKQPHMLKIDIDGYDRDVLASILAAGFQPDFIQIEVQPEIPPPVVFSVMYHPLYQPKYGFGGFYGCSISAIEALVRNFDYDPISLDNTTKNTHDMILVRHDLLVRTDLEALDARSAFEREPARNLHFPQVGIDSSRWQKRTDYYQLIADIFEACVFSSQATFGVILPFELGLDFAGLSNLVDLKVCKEQSGKGRVLMTIESSFEVGSACQRLNEKIRTVAGSDWHHRFEVDEAGDFLPANDLEYRVTVLGHVFASLFKDRRVLVLNEGSGVYPALIKRAGAVTVTANNASWDRCVAMREVSSFTDESFQILNQNLAFFDDQQIFVDFNYAESHDFLFAQNVIWSLYHAAGQSFADVVEACAHYVTDGLVFDWTNAEWANPPPPEDYNRENFHAALRERFEYVVACNDWLTVALGKFPGENDVSGNGPAEAT